MNEDQPETLSLNAAAKFGAAHGIEREVADIRRKKIEWERSATTSVKRGYIISLFEERGLFDAFKSEYWRLGNTGSGESKRRRYLRYKEEYEAWLEGPGLETAPVDEDKEPEQEESLEFALEAHLRDFLADNLELIEPGLRLHETAGRKAIEFPVDRGFIDLLAIDRNEKFVVLELKLSQGRNKALGQLAYYMAWVDNHLKKGPCRGFIIGSDIDEQLSVAVSRVPGVSLAKYRMSFAIEPVGKNL
jgi:hypothetical protein